MIILRSELNKYFDLTGLNQADLTTAFTALGYEVESVSSTRTVNGVKFGKVLACHPHPNADKLQFCQLKTGENIYNVICGGTNIAKDQFVIHALPGSFVNGKELKAKDLRGIESEGMVLSFSEIYNLEWPIVEHYQHHHILELTDITEKDLHNKPDKYLGLDDEIYDLTILPDREYAKNYLMLAIELSALLNKPLNQEIFNDEELKRLTTGIHQLKIKNNFNYKQVIIFDGTFVWNSDSRYLNLFKTLAFSKIPLTNNFNDIIKYLQLKLGVTIIPLYKQYKVTLSDKLLNQSQIDNLRSGEEYTFICVQSNEQGFSANNLNPEVLFNELKQFLQLTITDITSFKNHQLAKQVIKLEQSFINSYVGIKLNLTKDLLQQLKICGFKIEDKLKWTIPFYRQDINGRPDLIEELIRFYDINKLPEQVATNSNKPPVNEKHQNAIKKLSELLPKLGISEVKSYQLITEQKAKLYNLWNNNQFYHLNKAHNKDVNTLRTSFAGSLIETYSYNYRRNTNDRPIALYEWGNLYHDKTAVFSLGILIDNFLLPQAIPTLILKEMIEIILKEFNYDERNLHWSELNSQLKEVFELTNSAVGLNENDDEVVIIGEIASAILRDEKLIRVDKVKRQLYYAEIKLTQII